MSQLEIYLPPPTNWQDFQRLVEEVAEVRYVPETVLPYGRTSQRQHGVDVYAEDRFGARVGFQCKETKNALSLSTVEAEADKARSFPNGLDFFVVVTTDRTDTDVQDGVIALNAKKRFPFVIQVEFWDDLVNFINRSARVLNSCYEAYAVAFKQTDEARHLGCLRIAFDRPAFCDDFQHERRLDDFEEALVATKRLFRTGFCIDRWSQLPVIQTVPVDSLPNGRYRKFVYGIERKLETIYNTYLSEKDRMRFDQRHARDRAGHYNIMRRKLLDALNKELKRASLAEIDFAYSK